MFDAESGWEESERERERQGGQEEENEVALSAVGGHDPDRLIPRERTRGNAYYSKTHASRDCPAPPLRATLPIKSNTLGYPHTIAHLRPMALNAGHGQVRRVGLEGFLIFEAFCFGAPLEKLLVHPVQRQLARRPHPAV